MKHASSAQISPDIAETVALHARAARGTMGKAENLGFGVLVRPHLGRIELSGGAYGKYRFKVVRRSQNMKKPPVIKEMINEKAKSPRIHFATSTKDGKPNVVPVSCVEAISDYEVLIVDTLFDKTRRNLEENPQVAIGVEVLEEFKAYQLKGKASIFTTGELFEKALQLHERYEERRKLRHLREGIHDPEWLNELHQRKPKAAVLVEIEEIYSTINPDQNVDD
ncbi:MAG: pyridoxamine 5'-phosphate oxidase family protein [Actinomycetota bacterium]|nr:pyridoxamine 5'-phosphate oxidase family protein [Actinomycetota bacterium]